MATENLPFFEDAQSSMSDQQLEALKKQYVREGEYATIQTKFNYAWGLITSGRSNDNETGVKLLTGELGGIRDCWKEES